MNYQAAKEKFLCENGFYTTEQIQPNETAALEEWRWEGRDISGVTAYFKKIPTEMSDEEFNSFLNLLQTENTIQTSKNINIVKICVIVMAALTVAFALFYLIGVVQMIKTINEFMEAFKF